MSLYGAASGGAAIYTETHSTIIFKGVFQLVIGSITPIPSTLAFDKPYFIGVGVDGGAELVPRTAMTTAPYAFNAITAAIANSLAPNATGVVTSVNEKTGALTLQGGGSTTVTNTGNTFTISSTGGGGGGFSIPFNGVDSATTTDVFKIISTLGANAVVGIGNAGTGVNGRSISGNGVLGQSQSGISVVGIQPSNGTNSAGFFQNLNTNNTASTLIATTNGTGGAIKATITTVTGIAPAILGQTSSSSHGNNSLNSAAGVQGESLSGTPGAWSVGVRGINRGGNDLGAGVIGYHGGTGFGVYAETGGAGWAVRAICDGAGTGLYGEAQSNGNALVANINGAGASTTSANNIAIFQSVEVNQARIDRAGKGFFNGGTQTGGADVAEAFAVVGERSGYEPGDVLVIARGHKRTVTKCTKAYSTCVIGVHATKPGVLLTEQNVDADLSGLVPMGVMGVLPTKVCNEGGVIEAGDLLVTSSKTGYAMKGDEKKMRFGTILGKALEGFNGTSGTINVFVNVK